MKEDEKRRLRKMKREVKREGNRNRRRALKRSLERNPDEAQFDRYTFDPRQRRADSSAVWNAPPADRKRVKRATRARSEEEE
jgi:hypothetical protein